MKNRIFSLLIMKIFIKTPHAQLTGTSTDNRRPSSPGSHERGDTGGGGEDCNSSAHDSIDDDTAYNTAHDNDRPPSDTAHPQRAPLADPGLRVGDGRARAAGDDATGGGARDTGGDARDSSSHATCDARDTYASSSYSITYSTT